MKYNVGDVVKLKTELKLGNGTIKEDTKGVVVQVLYALDGYKVDFETGENNIKVLETHLY